MKAINYLFILILFSCKDSLLKKTETSSVEQTPVPKIKIISKKTSYTKEPFDLKKEKLDYWLSLSTSYDDIQNKLNNQQYTDSLYFSESIGCDMNIRRYIRNGLCLEFMKFEDNSQYFLNSIIVTEKSGMKTIRNIGIGNKRSDILLKYDINTAESSLNTIVVGDIYEGLFFNLKEDKIISYKLGAMAE